ncbi:MAG: T9SS type A sorting domain-containing protein [Hymenobacter sp.]|nr:MAG: T9SS type A sorting domain-containing protein [Hymenobacter sp.]
MKLYETSNQIEFVYGAATAATTGTVIGRYATIGLKSASGIVGQTLLVSKGSSATAWSTATFVSGTGTRLFFRSTFLPDAGRTFRYTVGPANDGAVNAIYTLGKLPIPAALPHAVQASITNAGSQALTNLPVTLSVSGANTFTNVQTVATLAAGATALVTFANYPATLVAGVNNLTVTIPADAVATNNSATWQQTVSTTPTFSYVPPDQPSAYSAYGGGTAGLIFALKYTTQTAGAVSSVNVYIGDASAVGRTVAGVVLSTAGAILARSADYVVQATDVSSYKTFTISMPPTIAAGGSFLAGLQQVAYTGATAYPVGIQQEIPGRPATYYTVPVAGGTPSDIGTSNYRFMIEANTVTPAACASVTGLTATNLTATGATLTFTDPASAGSYQVIYGPTGFDPATGGTTITITASPYTLTALQPGNAYDVYVRTNCTGGGTSYLVGPVNVVTPCVNTAAISGFPYTESFDNIPTGQALPCGITVLDTNADNVTWRISTENPNSGTRNMRYQGILATVAANDWFFTPALALPNAPANTRFQVSFRYRAAGTGSTGTSNFTEALEVKSGASATVAGQTNLLYTNNSINNLVYAQANSTSAPVVAYLPAGASTQYVGFHVKSAALQSNLYIDDLSVTAVIITATSEALLRAVSVFPNPSTTGVFNLEVNGANAQKGLEVEVVNNLGQRVYTGTARDNFTTQLDLGNLATGLYHLKVKNGGEYLVRQLSIVK